MSELDDCFKKRMLIRIQPSIDLAQKSLRQAQAFLSEAEKLTGFKSYAMGEIALYNAYFHTAKSLLYKDGINERSHFCLARYVQDKYKDVLDRKYLEAMDELRKERHEIQYGFSMLEERMDIEDIKNYIHICKDFLGKIKKLLN